MKLPLATQGKFAYLLGFSIKDLVKSSNKMCIVLLKVQMSLSYSKASDPVAKANTWITMVTEKVAEYSFSKF